MAYFSVSPSCAARNLVAYRLVFGTPNERMAEFTPSNLYASMRAAGYDVSEAWVRNRIRMWYREGMLDVEDGRFVVVG